MKQHFFKFLPIYFFAGVVIILFFRVIFLGQVLYEGDNFHLNIPAKYFLVDQIHHGIFPLWNPYLFLGIPYFADLNVGVLFPLNLIYFLFSIPRGLTITALLDIFFIGIFQYIFLQKLSLSKLSSLLGAFIFTLGGMPFLLFGNITYLNVIVYIPLLFSVAILLSKTKRILWLFVLIGLQALQILSGHPQQTYYTMLTLCFYFLFFSSFTWRQRVVITVFYGAAALLVSSIQLVPFFEFVLHATRGAHSLSYASQSSVTLSQLPVFLFPLLYGNHADGNWWGPQAMLAGYIGIPTLLFIWIAIRNTTFPLKTMSVIGLVFSFLLAFGKYTPLFYIFYFLIPGWQFFRAPSGLLVFYTFFASILAAHGFFYLEKKKILLGKWSITGLAFLLALFCITFMVLIFTRFLPQGIMQSFHFLTTKIHVLEKVFIFSDSKILGILTTALWNFLLVSGGFLIALLCIVWIKNKNYLIMSLFILTLFSLLIPDSKVVVTTLPQLYSENLSTHPMLKDAQSGVYRILSLPVNLHQDRKNLPGNDYFLREAKANLAIYKDDNNIQQYLYSASGYNALIPSSYALFLGNSLENDITGVDMMHVNPEQLNQLSIKYILSHEKLPQNTYNNIPLQLIASSDNYFIYENKTAYPRAYVLGKGKVSNSTFHSQTLSFTTKTNDPTAVIVTNWYYPGWKAFINGKKVPIVPYKNTFQQITIPKGNSIVQFIYDPDSFKIGAVITDFALIVGIIIAISLKKKKI